MPPRARADARAHAIVSLATVVTFARAVPYPLQLTWDDARFIADNPDVHEVSWRSLVSILGAPHFQAYHPLHLLSYWLDVPWFGTNAAALHAVSLLLWVIAANVLLRALRSIGLGPLAAVIACLACVLHPIQVEAVSWATGRKDALALLFASACMLAHFSSERGFDRNAWLARGAYVLGALSKTTILPLPLLLVAGDVLLRKRPLRRALAPQLPSIALGAGLSCIVIAIWKQEQMMRGQVASVGPLPLRVVATFAHALGTALWPSATSPMYDVSAVNAPGALAYGACAALLAGVFFAWRARARLVLFGLIAFGVLMLPVCNAIPMYFPYQDRYLSLPLLGLAIVLGAAVDAAAPRGLASIVTPLAIAAVAALALRTIQYQGAWQSETRLWGHAASTQPNAYYAWTKLGEVRRKQGDFDGAIRAYKQLVRIDPLRKLGYAGLFQAVAERDEKLHAIAPSRAEDYAKAFYAALDDAEDLRVLAARLLQAGYVRAFELPMGRVLVLSPMPDDALEHAAALQFEQNQPSVALFLLEHMQRPTQQPVLQALAQRARALRGGGPVL
jgi:tetratricopeptide (TPR) repeat protein